MEPTSTTTLKDLVMAQLNVFVGGLMNEWETKDKHDKDLTSIVEISKIRYCVDWSVPACRMPTITLFAKVLNKMSFFCFYDDVIGLNAGIPSPLMAGVFESDRHFFKFFLLPCVAVYFYCSKYRPYKNIC